MLDKNIGFILKATSEDTALKVDTISSNCQKDYSRDFSAKKNNKNV